MQLMFVVMEDQVCGPRTLEPSRIPDILSVVPVKKERTDDDPLTVNMFFRTQVPA